VTSARGGRHAWRVEASLVLLLAALTAFTIALIASPQVAPALVHGRLELAINVGALLVAGAVAGLAWGRYREGYERASLYRSSAFLVLGGLNLLIIGTMVVGLEAELGFDLADPGPFPLLLATAARGLAALLLVVAGIFAVRRAVGPLRWAWAILLGPALALIGLLVVGLLEEGPLLPWLIEPAVVKALARDPTQQLTAPLSLGLAFSNGLIAVGFFAAAGLAYLAYRRTGKEWDAILAMGLVLAAFSAVHGILHPGAYLGLVTTADLLRVSFYGVILVGLFAESREDVRALRSAHGELRRLHEADVLRATQEERSRLAREIHDGLAQDLWYAKLKQDRLAKADVDADERDALTGEVADALDSALAEARQAVMALRPADEAPFDVTLRRYVEDFGDRFGILAECRVDAAPAGVSPRAHAELLRVVQEALNNVRKHADATLVRVEGQTDANGLRLTITDNGRGFDPSEPSSGYGLISMRERAAIIGASIEIDSRPQDGTRVEIRLGP
jgi:signal transduction histidine kinase